MAREPGIVQINQYRQRTNPSGPARPKAIAQDVPDPFGGMLEGLAEGGEAVARMFAAREEDDARAYSARAVAEATMRYSERATELEANAPDGWRNLARDSNAAFETIDQEYLDGAPTARARDFVGQHLSVLRSQFVTRQAERENSFRRDYLIDTIDQSTTTAGSVIVADPTQYERLDALLVQTIGSMTGFSANDRRDQLATRRGELAVSYFQGMIERDPAAALRQLRGTVATSANPDAIASLVGGTVTSTQRDPQHNAEVGGVPNSMHLTGEAVDLTVPERYQGMGRQEIEADVRQRLTAAGVEASEVLFEGDHIHVGWRGAAGGEGAAAQTDGPASRLSGAQRATLINQAQTAGNAADAYLRDTISRHNQLLQRGIMPEQPLDPAVIAAPGPDGRIRAGLGPDVAQTYIANLAGVAAVRGLADQPIGTVAQIAAGSAQTAGGDVANLVTVETRNAAQAMLRERREDPGLYGLNHDLLPHADLLPQLGQALQSGDWSEAGVALRQRGAIAVSLRDRGVVQMVAPFSIAEAQALSQSLASMPTQARIQFYSNMSQNMDREAYLAVMGQVAQNAPVAAFAGFLWSNPAGRSQNTRGAAETLLRGMDLLNGGDASQNGRRSPLITMPSEENLRTQFENVTGRAFEHLRGTARPGENDPAEDAYQVYRAYYAGLTQNAPSDTIDTAVAQRAAALATGGVTQWGPRDRETLMPWGMRRSEFEDGVRRGFERIGQRGVNPRDYELRAMGEGRYQVFVGESPARNARGGPLVIQVTRPPQ